MANSIIAGIIVYVICQIIGPILIIFIRPIREFIEKRKRVFIPIITLSAILCLFLDITIGTIWLNYAKISHIAPQLAPLGFITSYSSNGCANFELEEKGTIHALKMELQAYGNPDLNNGIVSDCGVIIARKLEVIHLLNGYNISRYSILCFLARGERGGEQFGVALKNVSGDETKIPLKTLAECKPITSDAWQKITIPLDRFGRATQISNSGVREKIENISFFTNSLLAGTSKQTIYVANVYFD